MREDPCPELRRRIGPFISSGENIVLYKGMECNVCKPVPLEERTVWVCILIDRDFVYDWEYADHRESHEVTNVPQF